MMLGLGAEGSPSPTPPPPPAPPTPPPPFTPGPLRFHRNVFGPWVFGSPWIYGGPYEERVLYEQNQWPPWLVPVLIGAVVILAVRK